MRILIASVTNRDASILTPHIESIKRLRTPKGVTFDLAYISDGLSDDNARILLDAGARVSEALPKPPEAIHDVGETTTEWSIPTFGWLAREKQRLLDLAAEEAYDGIFFVDSDLVLGEETLVSLVAAQKDVVSAVFWTKWQPDAPSLPQVWMRHPYEFDGRGQTADDFLRKLDGKALTRVGGLGACTLISASVFDRVRWFPLMEGLPTGGMWQGEDRHFCIHAERNHVELWADAWPDVFHIYRPSDVDHISDFAFGAHVFEPAVGDWVSITLEALEERELFGFRAHLRGRLGALDVLPEIESALRGMYVGDSQVVKVSFPVWWSIEAYRGKTRNVLVRLVDAKRYE